MRHMLLCTVLVGLSGCNKSDGDSAGDRALEPQVVGTITVPGLTYEQDAEGRVEIFHGYGVDAGGTVMMYLSSNPNLTCAMAAEILSDRDSPLDFTDYIVGGTCDLFIKTTDYTGAMDFSEAAGFEGMVAMTINCYTGSGAFQYEQRDDGGDNGYYWSGRKWQGNPTVYSYSLNGGNESDYTVALDLVEYDGNFPDETDAGQSYPATGTVSGTVDVKWCADLGRTEAFTGG